MASSAFLVFKIFQGRTPEPPFQKCIVILLSNTAQYETSWKVYNSRSDRTHMGVYYTLICDLLANDLLYPLLVIKIQC